MDKVKTDNRPLITYALTTYNLEEYVRESVSAAFAQTYSPLEIILSDDCSTDRTFEIMQEMVAAYQGPHRIILTRNEQNLRVVRHCNKVYMDLAHGELIVIAHGDDLSRPERTEKAWEYMKKHPECSGLSFSVSTIDEDGIAIKELQRSTQVDSYRTFTLNNATIENGIPNIPSPSRTIRRSVMDAFGPFSGSCPTEDDPLGFRILMSGTAAFLPDIMVNYRKHRGSESSSANFARFPLVKIYKQQLIDVRTAKRKGIITLQQADNLKNVLNVNMRRRYLTRAHFQYKNLKTLSAILFSRLFSLRFKLSRIRFHFVMLRHPELYR